MGGDECSAVKIQKKIKAMSILNLENYNPNIQNQTPPVGDLTAQKRRVKSLGVIACILVVIGIFIPFISHTAAYLLARRALKISRQFLVPIK